MRRILSTILFNLFVYWTLTAQNIHQIKDFSDQQFIMGNYQVALKEYQRTLFFDKENLYNDLYEKIACIHFIQSDFDAALKYYDLALRIENNDSVKFELTLRKALCSFKLNNYYEAMYELLDLPDHHDGFLGDRKNLYMGICFYGLNEYDKSRICFTKLIDSSGVEEIDSLFSDLERIKKKYRPEKVRLMSLILPGLGQIYTGNVFNGINSFVIINGVVCYAVVTAMNYGIIDGILILSSWFYRYYSGGYTNAANFANNKIELEKSRIYYQILNLIEDYQKQKLE